jgi:hypothetical protein
MPPPFLIPALMAGGSLLGGLFGNRNQQQQSQTTNTNSQTSGLQQSQQEGTSSGLSRPIYDALQGNLRDQLLMQYMQRASGAGAAEQANEQYFSTLRGLNSGTNRLKENIAENYASRGLQYSPATSVALSEADNQRFGNVVNLQSSMPALYDELLRQRLGDASGYLSSLPVATANDQVSQQTGQVASNQTTQGTSQTTGNTAQTAGGGFGGGVQSLFTTLAGLYGNGAFSQPTRGVTSGPYTAPNGINPNFQLPSNIFRFNNGLARN